MFIDQSQNFNQYRLKNDVTLRERKKPKEIKEKKFIPKQ